MALKKNKIQILEKITNKSEDIKYSGRLDDYECYYDDDDDWEENKYYYDNYDYLENSICMINMKSIYPKNIIREKIINQILGISFEIKNPTIGDLYPI